MRKSVGGLLLFICFGLTVLYGSTISAQPTQIVPLSNPEDLRADDGVDWRDMAAGRTSVVLQAPVVVTSRRGLQVVLTGPHEFEVSLWKTWHFLALHHPPIGPFVPSPEDALLQPHGYPKKYGDYVGVPTFHFELASPVKGFGLSVVSLFPYESAANIGPWIVTIRILDDSGTLLASFAAKSSPDHVIYVGATSANSNIKSFEVSDFQEKSPGALAAPYHSENDFAIGQLNLLSGSPLRPCCYSTTPAFPAIRSPER